MKKLLVSALAGMAMLLGACVSGGELTPAQSDFLRDAAINRIAAFNAAGIQIVELTPLQLLALDTACFAATAAALFAVDENGEPRVAPVHIQKTCAVIMAAAQARVDTAFPPAEPAVE